MTAPTSNAGATGSSGRGAGVAVVLAVVAIVVAVVLMTRTRQLTPFMVDSTAPEGYAAVAALWEEDGATVGTAASSSLLDRPGGEAVDGRVVVVPVPGFASGDELRELRRLAEAGATVVLGEPWPLDEREDGELDELLGSFDPSLIDPTGSYDARELADTPAVPVDPSRCDIDGLDEFGPIDSAFAFRFPVGAADRSCYSGGDALGSGELGIDGDSALVSVREVGEGRIVTLASPYLWVNARLQPVKEEGGLPLANAGSALVLTGAAPGVRIQVIDPTPSADAELDGDEGTWQLMPLPVQLALAQLVVAAAVFVWWRSVRLGRAVEEPLPVEIAGSELVVAVGDLLRRKGNPQRAAEALRRETRVELAGRLGATGASDDVLIATVASRTGRPPAEVHATLIGDGPIDSDTALVQLARSLESIRTEVLSVPAPA